MRESTILLRRRESDHSSDRRCRSAGGRSRPTPSARGFQKNHARPDDSVERNVENDDDRISWPDVGIVEASKHEFRIAVTVDVRDGRHEKVPRVVVSANPLAGPRVNLALPETWTIYPTVQPRTGDYIHQESPSCRRPC